MDLSTTRLVYDDYSQEHTDAIVRADVDRFLSRAYILYKALFNQDRAILKPEDWPGYETRPQDYPLKDFEGGYL